MLRVLIVEDSSAVAMLLKAIFNNEPDMQVVGHARNGREGIQMVHDLNPDVVTMDIRMPVMDGFEATRIIMACNPVPIVVVSSSVDNEELRITFRAIEEGALAVMEKPRGFTHPEFDAIRRDLVDTVRSMAGVRMFKRRKFESASKINSHETSLGQHANPLDGSQTHASEPCNFSPAQPGPGQKESRNFSASSTGGEKGEWSREADAQHHELLAIGCSTGGPQVLRQIFSLLPTTFPVPIMVTQHISRGFSGGLVSWLACNTLLDVKLAEHGEPLKPGTIYFAPDDQHLLVTRIPAGLVAQLSQDAPCNGFRPSASPMFKSVALVCRQRAVGLLLTGMGTDGADGLLELRRAGGHTVVQDQESAVVYGMPGEAIALDAVDRVVALDSLPAYLSDVVGQQ